MAVAPVLLTELVGWVATFLSIVSLLPQIWKTWRTRSTKDLSYLWLTLALLASLAWLAYGLLLPAPAVIWANLLNGAMVCSLLAMKWRFD